MSDIYGEPGFLTQASGESYDDGLGIDDVQVLDHENGEHVAPNDLLGFHNAGPRESVMSAEPHRFNSSAHRKTKTVASYANVPSLNTPVANGAGYILGVNIANPTATPVTVILHDGWDVSGVRILALTVPANDSRTMVFPFPIRYRLALYFECPVSTVLANVFLEDMD